MPLLFYFPRSNLPDDTSEHNDAFWMEFAELLNKEIPALKWLPAHRAEGAVFGQHGKETVVEIRGPGGAGKMFAPAFTLPIFIAREVDGCDLLYGISAAAGKLVKKTCIVGVTHLGLTECPIGGEELDEYPKRGDNHLLVYIDADCPDQTTDKAAEWNKMITKLPNTTSFRCDGYENCVFVINQKNNTDKLRSDIANIAGKVFKWKDAVNFVPVTTVFQQFY
jgi:hypothetical protein